MANPAILFVDQSGELGGAELSLLDIAQNYRGNCEVLLFEDGPFRERLERAGVRVTVPPSVDRVLNVSREHNFFKAMLALPNLFNVARIVARKSRRYDIIYANTQKAFIVSSLASVVSRRPLIWHLRDMLTASHFSGAMRAVAVFLANWSARCVITNSRATAEAFVRAGGRCRTVVIHNGIDPVPFQKIDVAAARVALRSQIGNVDGPIVGVFSRLALWKGQHVAIEAARLLPGVHFVFVGEALFNEKSYEARLHRDTDLAGIRDRIHFLGFRNDVAALMSAVDVILHTSIAPEPFGRVIVEGMLAQKPVIATAAGGALEILEDGVTGLLVPPGDAGMLAAALRTVLSSPGVATDMARRGQREARQRFSLAACLSAIGQLLEDGGATYQRVLFVDQSGELGGAELSLLDIAQNYRGNCEVLLFEDGPFRERLERAGVRVTVPPSVDRVLNVSREHNFFKAMLALPNLFNVARIVARKSRRYDIIYANTQKAFIVSSLASVVSRRPLIWHLHDMLTASHFSGAMRAVAVFLANWSARCVITNSRATAEAFVRAGGRCRTVVIYNGIDPVPFQKIDVAAARVALRSQIGNVDGPIVGVFSRLALWKGQHVAIEAARLLPGVHFVFVGEALFNEKSYEARLHRDTDLASIRDRIHFLGFRNDVAALMSAVDVILHTSIAPEPFGRVIVEGMLAQKPVIATAAGGALEILEDGVTGLLVPPGDVSRLVIALSEILANPKLADEMALRAKKMATDRFSLWESLILVDETLRKSEGLLPVGHRNADL